MTLRMQIMPWEQQCVTSRSTTVRQLDRLKRGVEEASWSGRKQRTQLQTFILRFKNIIL
jgi:hypothetical protein